MGKGSSPTDDVMPAAMQMPSQHDIEEAALQANAHGFICDLPLAYDTPVTDKCVPPLAKMNRMSSFTIAVVSRFANS